VAGGFRDGPEHAVFDSAFDFEIPEYQRPYSWGVDETLQLLDDLEGVLDRQTLEQ